MHILPACRLFGATKRTRRRTIDDMQFWAATGLGAGRLIQPESPPSTTAPAAAVALAPSAQGFPAAPESALSTKSRESAVDSLFRTPTEKSLPAVTTSSSTASSSTASATDAGAAGGKPLSGWLYKRGAPRTNSLARSCRTAP